LIQEGSTTEVTSSRVECYIGGDAVRLAIESGATCFLVFPLQVPVPAGIAPDGASTQLPNALPTRSETQLKLECYKMAHTFSHQLVHYTRVRTKLFPHAPLSSQLLSTGV